MAQHLKLSIGQHSEKGRKETNQDFHGALIPREPKLGLKGAAVVLADGISSSTVSHVASESAVKGFLADYYCTSDSWSVKTSAYRVIAATNSWLHAQTRRGQNPYDKDKGYVCTLSAIIVKSTTAHLFHVGDSRIYRVAGNSLEQLTEDHRVQVSSEQSYLSRAMGVNHQIEIDYRSLQIDKGDIFLLATDGVYAHVPDRFIIDAIRDNAGDLDKACRNIVDAAYSNGSADNLTVQIVRIDELPDGEASEALGQAEILPLPPLLEPRASFDGFRIVREIHGSSRSHIYLAVDDASGDMVALKIPSLDLRGEPAYLRRFMMEEWVAQRLNNAHVLKPRDLGRKRNFLYIVTEYVEGQTLTQWMIDNPKPDLATVRNIVAQIAEGLRSFHRKEMLHQDLRPDNIMIDKTGTVKIIDFGSTRVAGIAEAAPRISGQILGTVQYTAPEYFVGDGGTPRSDLFSLGVITYQMLTGRLPYGAGVSRARTRRQQRKLRYATVHNDVSTVPAWIDGVLKRAVHINPLERQDALSEFIEDLRTPSERYLGTPPLLERNPLLFWKGLSLILALVIVALLYWQNLGPR